MSPIFDSLYLVSVDWAKKDLVNSFIPSQIPLEAIDEESSSEEFVYEIPMYHKIGKYFYQVAVKSTGCPLESGQPMFQIPNTNFWIIKGEWKINQANKGYHHCPSINTGGELNISVNGISIQVRIVPNIVDFDFEALKADFEGQLWDLLTLNSAKAKIKHLEHKAGNRIVHFANTDSIRAFIHEFEKIAKNPKCELKASSSDRPIDKVKPIPATFRKMAVAGASRSLPSKDFVENVDVYENRYLCWMLDKIGRIVQHSVLTVEQYVKRINAETTIIKNKIDELERPQLIKKEDLVEEINRQQHKINHLEETWKSISQNFTCISTADYESKNVFLWRKHTNLANTYWCKNPDFSLITFPLTTSSYLKEGESFRIELRIPHLETVTTQRGAVVPRFNAGEIKSMETGELDRERRILNKQKTSLINFETTGWEKELTEQEQQERDTQIRTLCNRLENLDVQLKNFEEFSTKLQDINLNLKKLQSSAFVQKVNIKRIIHFQPSMTFVQNTQYRNTIRHYQETFNSLGINMEVFDSFEQITEYGVREMPQVYELWVLVSIIKTLEGTYGYLPAPTDVERLVKEISPKNVKVDRALTVHFTEGLPGQRVTLFYQKALPNGKRPDFILEIQTDKNKIHLLLDAKFKNYQYQKNVVSDLHLVKGKYSASKHYVFIVHPCTDPKFSNLGSKAIYFIKDVPTMPFHQYGYLSAQPNFTDNFKKVIGMALEYLIEGSYNAKQEGGALDPKPQGEKLFCLNCGHNHPKLEQFLRPEPPIRYHYTNTCQNSKCGHVAYFDYCWNCKTKLYKHGSYWDYHRTSIRSAFDIHCPNCGLTVADYAG